MEIINTVTGEIIDILSINTTNDTALVIKKQTKYSEGRQEVNNIFIHERLKERILENCISDLLKTDEYIDFIPKIDFNDWLSPEKSFRFFITKEQVAWAAANAKELIDSIYDEPKNPYFEINGGFEVYINNPTPDALAFFEMFKIKLESRE